MKKKRKRERDVQYANYFCEETLELIKATKVFLAKLDKITKSPQYQGIWHMAAIHGMEYTGEDYRAELEALKKALSRMKEP